MSTARYKNLFSYANTMSTARDEWQNSIFLICSRMKELTFSRFIPKLGLNGFCSLLFTGKKTLLMKNSFFYSNMAADLGVSLSCFLEEEVILEVLNGLYMDDN